MEQRRVKSRICPEAKDQAELAMISSSPADAWNYIKRATFTAKGGDDDSLAPLQTLNQYLAYLVQGTQPVVPVGCNIANNFISVN